MNIVKIYAGLGNQLFQYAFGKAQSMNGLSVAYDLNWFKTGKHPNRPYHLDKFHTIVPVSRRQTSNLVRERAFSPILLKKDRQYYMGYWQSPMFFENCKHILQQEIRLKPEYYTTNFETYKNYITSSNSVSVHIRRGDYLDHPNHLVLDSNYYNLSISLLRKLKKNCLVFVFSDDQDWCKENIKGDIFVEAEQSYLEFELMRYCKHNIIANSTFSWWPAYLNDNSDKTIIAPSRWWKAPYQQSLIEQSKLIPSNWIKL